MPEIATRYPCPVCLGINLDPVKVGSGDVVEIDVCRRCGGVWLDYGEVQRLRGHAAATAWAAIGHPPVKPVTLCHSCHAPLDRALEKHANLFLDISARDYEVGRTPRAAAKFLAKHKDRVLFGTDMGREPSMYRAWWRLFETADEFMPGRVWWPYYGLELAAGILEPLYRGNARRLMNWQGR